MAKVHITKKVEYDAKYLAVEAEVRYWEDAKVNGVEDTDGILIPCRKGDIWCPIIDIDTGQIINWKRGTTARVHYKVCDAGTYELRTIALWQAIVKRDGYVPSCLSPSGYGYGDYIIMNIDENGMIEDWNFDPQYFEELEHKCL